MGLLAGLLNLHRSVNITSQPTNSFEVSEVAFHQDEPLSEARFYVQLFVAVKVAITP